MALEIIKKRQGEVQRYGGRSAERPIFVRGPLGIWPYPLINVLLQVVLVLRGLSTWQPGPVVQQVPFQRTASRRTEYIRDREGRIVEKYEEITLE
jgi:hypothetical protein